MPTSFADEDAGAHDDPLDHSDYGNYVSAEEEVQDMPSDSDVSNDDDEDDEEDRYDPYADDEQDNRAVFCSPKRNRRIALPFRSCSALFLLEESKSKSYHHHHEDEENEFHDAYYSEGELLGSLAGKRKRPRRISMLKNRIATSYSNLNLAPLSFSTDVIKYTDEELLMEDGDLPTHASDLRPRVVTATATAAATVLNESTSEKEPVVQCRSFHVITTAALPWMTGTAVNPLLRAAYLNKMNRTAVEQALGETSTKRVFDMMGTVTIVVPWLIDEEDQLLLYGDNCFFNTPHDQEVYIRDWVRNSADLPLEADMNTKGIQIS